MEIHILNLVYVSVDVSTYKNCKLIVFTYFILIIFIVYMNKVGFRCLAFCMYVYRYIYVFQLRNDFNYFFILFNTVSNNRYCDPK